MDQLRAGQITAALASAKEAFNLSGNLPGMDSGSLRTSKNIYAATLLAAGDLDAAKNLYGHRRAPDPFGVDLEYQGTLGNIDTAVKVLVFFETWCPYSQRYLPKVERLNRQYRDLGVEMIGVTETNRSASDATVRQFITDNEMTFSVLKENGRCSNYFDLPGVPATVILHEGEIIWDSAGVGALDRYMLEGIVAAK